MVSEASSGKFNVLSGLLSRCQYRLHYYFVRMFRPDKNSYLGNSSEFDRNIRSIHHYSRQFLRGEVPQKVYQAFVVFDFARVYYEVETDLILLLIEPTLVLGVDKV